MFRIKKPYNLLINNTSKMITAKTLELVKYSTV